MKSLKQKIILITLSILVVSVMVVGSTTLVFTYRLTEEDSQKLLARICEENAYEINSIMMNIEQSVNTVYQYGMSNSPSVAQLKNKDTAQSYMRDINNLLHAATMSTDNAVASYWRYNYDLNLATEGVLITKGKTKTENVIPTDIRLFSENDREHVAWYYEPINEEKPVWLKPYYNTNLGIYMISYVIPFYTDDGTPLGVVGMDIDISGIVKKVESVKIYETGKAYLLEGKNSNIVYHTQPSGGVIANEIDSAIINAKAVGTSNFYEYKADKETRICTGEMLNNYMVLFITVPHEEVNERFQNLVMIVCAILLVVLMLAILILWHWAKHITKPLVELTAATKQIGRGNYDINLDVVGNDEIGVLVRRFVSMAHSLKNYTTKLNNIAYIDTQTGCNNKSAYIKGCERAKEKIKLGSSFSVYMMDVNDLKITNDTFGHDRGNMLLIDSATFIMEIFGVNNVFRIGGDEFVALVETLADNKDINYLTEFSEKMNKMKANNQGTSVSVAIGCCNTNETDGDLDAAFKTADERMYENKRRMKENADYKN